MVSGCSSSAQYRKRQDKQIANLKLYIPRTSARIMVVVFIKWLCHLFGANGTSIISLFHPVCHVRYILRSSSAILLSRINFWVYPAPKLMLSCSKLDSSIWWCLFFALEEQKGLNQTAWWIGLACFQSCCTKDVLVGLRGGNMQREPFESNAFVLMLAQLI